MSRVQPTFRLALAVLIVALVALTVLAVGASSRYFGRKNATALSTQVLDQTLQRIEDDDYGFCDSCGVEIGIRRLEARPTATLCIDCETLAEIKEKQVGS